MSSRSSHSDILYSQKWVKVFFLHLWPQQLYKAFRFGTHTYIAIVLNCMDFRNGWAIFGPLVATNTQKGGLSRAPRHGKVSGAFFLYRYELEIWYTKPVGGTTHQVCVSSQACLCLWILFQTIFLNVLMYQFESWFTFSRLHNILSSCYTRMGSLWSTSCSYVYDTYVNALQGVILPVLRTEYAANGQSVFKSFMFVLGHIKLIQ